jgi:hypothetical protein
MTVSATVVNSLEEAGVRRCSVIQVDIDPDVVGVVVPVELGVVAGARETLAALVSLAPSSGPALVEVVTDPDLITPTARLSELGKATTG